VEADRVLFASFNDVRWRALAFLGGETIYAQGLSRQLSRDAAARALSRGVRQISLAEIYNSCSKTNSDTAVPGVGVRRILTQRELRKNASGAQISGHPEWYIGRENKALGFARGRYDQNRLNGSEQRCETKQRTTTSAADQKLKSLHR